VLRRTSAGGSAGYTIAHAKFLLDKRAIRSSVRGRMGPRHRCLSILFWACINFWAYVNLDRRLAATRCWIRLTPPLR